MSVDYFIANLKAAAIQQPGIGFSLCLWLSSSGEIVQGSEHKLIGQVFQDILGGGVQGNEITVQVFQNHAVADAGENRPQATEGFLQIPRALREPHGHLIECGSQHTDFILARDAGALIKIALCDGL